MSSVAVFVDAGYLFAQGSTAISGSKKPRSGLTLNETAVIAELTSVASAKTNGLRLLRVYWYDAARGSAGLTLDHAALAHTDYVKLRLGFINSQKQQKGVDSLIVTDLIELARNRAMSDAVLMSGDEDVRIGVQIAQSFGVRVHLLGIKPSRGSQSQQLMQESDTTTEWDSSVVSRFLTVHSDTADKPLTVTISATESGGLTGKIDDPFTLVIRHMLDNLSGMDISKLIEFWTNQTGLPSEIDGKLIARCRSEIGRDLDAPQKRDVRRRFIAGSKAMAP